MPLENIPSVLKLGILSNERAANVPHYSVALEVVQERNHPSNPSMRTSEGEARWVA